MYFICRIEFMLLGIYAAAIFLKHMFVLKNWTAGFWEVCWTKLEVVQPYNLSSSYQSVLFHLNARTMQHNSAWHTTRIDCNVSSIYTCWCLFVSLHKFVLFTELLQTNFKWHMSFHSCRTTSNSLLSAYCNQIKNSPNDFSPICRQQKTIVFSHFCGKSLSLAYTGFTNGRHRTKQLTTWILFCAQKEVGKKQVQNLYMFHLWRMCSLAKYHWNLICHCWIYILATKFIDSLISPP